MIKCERRPGTGDASAAGGGAPRRFVVTPAAWLIRPADGRMCFRTDRGSLISRAVTDFGQRGANP
jgi:hypothetical protein